MSWSERINTAASGSGRVDDIKGHLQSEFSGPTKLVKMRGRDEMDGQLEGRECGMQSSQMEPAEAVRHRQCEALSAARESGGIESIILSRGLESIRDSRIACKDGFRDTP